MSVGGVGGGQRLSLWSRLEPAVPQDLPEDGHANSQGCFLAGRDRLLLLGGQDRGPLSSRMGGNRLTRRWPKEQILPLECQDHGATKIGVLGIET